MSMCVHLYHQYADFYSNQYSSLSFESVHQSWQTFWPSVACSVLDVGAGNGRDASWFEQLGCDIIAVEPADGLRAIGAQKTGVRVQWLEDQLPALHKVQALGVRFDIILLSAVWMHIPPSERARCFRKLSNLLSVNGILVITLRHGSFSDGRVAHPVSVEELQKLSNQYALNNLLCTDKADDQLGRKDVCWQTMVFRMPDDGSGSLSKIRKIIVNDHKSSTYKLALLRTLLRIADAHPGAVLDRTDGKVSLPLGLVALYWIRLYKRLIEPYNIAQSANTNLGLGFVKPEGWGKLTSLRADDFAIGAIFMGDQAQALQKLMLDSINTIEQGPVTYIYQGEKNNPLFSIQKLRRQRQETLVLDRVFLASFGVFVLDASQWECFRLYGSWIDPLLVQQWIVEMQRYQFNKERNLALQVYYDGLLWLDKNHDTSPVRQKVKTLLGEGYSVTSVWSNAKLLDQFHIDHCLPFSYWPNNDKWNLLPTTEKENLNKSNRLPSAMRLKVSRRRIIDWWQLAWQTQRETDQFFQQANLSLPNLALQSLDFDAVFDAMQFQVCGVKQRLQIGEW